MLLVGSCSGLLVAYDARTGDEYWNLNVAVDGANQFHGDPFVRGNAFYVGTDAGTQNPDGFVYAVDLTSGEVIWKSRASPGATSDIVGNDSCIFVATLGDEVLCLRHADGTYKWRFRTSWKWASESLYEPYADHFGLVSSPVLHGRTVYYAGHDSVLYAVNDRSGELRWKRRFPAEFRLAATVTGRGLLVGTSDSVIHLLDFASGRTVSSHRVGTVPLERPHVAGDAVIFLSEPAAGASTQLQSYDLQGDSVVWRSRSHVLGADARFSVPRLHLYNGAILLGSQNGTVAAISPTDGGILWQVQTVGAIRGIGSSGKFLFVGNLDGHLYVYHLP